MRIKQIPEDFVVKELIDVKLEGGDYIYFKLKKKSWNTLSAIKEISKRLGIKEKFISFAGIKDKHAITEQVLAAYKVSKERLESLDIKDIDIKVLGSGKEKIHTDLLQGNEFEIVVRDLDAPTEKEVSYIPNYFDEQRFGIEANNHLAGKALVKKDFRKACEILNLEVEGNNFILALQRNKKLLKLIFNSYQSYLFNEALIDYIKSKSKKVSEVECSFGTLVFTDYHDNLSFPLIQFDTELEGEIGKIYEKILKKEGINQRDFIIRQFPELISQTQFRKAFVKVEEFSIKTSEDELNKEKIKQTLKFRLPKGSYATIVVKSLYNQD